MLLSPYHYPVHFAAAAFGCAGIVPTARPEIVKS
jgi:hypothetical protein